jgi:hypothetical protein
MMRDFPEADWKVFKKLSPVALERFCGRVLGEVESTLAKPGESAHERYTRIYKLMRDRDKELSRAFDDFRRSTAFMQIGTMYSMGLITEEELMPFTPPTREGIKAIFGCHSA